MDPVEFVSPDGHTQLVEAPADEYRLRAAGWRPRPELETYAPTDPAAAARLRLAEEKEAEREARRRERHERETPAAPEAAAARAQRAQRPGRAARSRDAS